MVQIKAYDREIQAQNIGSQYIDGGNVQGAFGEGIARATANLADMGFRISATLDKIQEEQDRQKAVELKNAIYQQWEKPTLYEQNGYFNQLGRNASGRSGEILQSYDDFVQQKSKELGLNSRRGQRYVGEMLGRTRERISRDVLSHDLKQTQDVTKNEASLLIQNVTQQGINDRNTSDGIERCVNDVTSATINYAQTANLDEAQTKLLVNANVSNAIASIIAKCNSEDSLKGKEILEKYGNYLTPEIKQKLEDSCKQTEFNVVSTSFATDCYSKGLNIQQATDLALSEKNISLRDEKVRKVTQYYSLKESAQKKVEQDRLENEMNTIASLTPEQLMNYKAPLDIEPTNRVRLENYRDALMSGNGPQADTQTYLNLVQMSMTNAENFSKVNLNLYRDKLSTSDFKDLSEKQLRIKQHGYSEISETDEIIVDTAKKFGWWQEGPMADVVQGLINTDEARYGKKNSKEQLNSSIATYTNLLSAKGKGGKKSAYDILKQNLTKEFLNKVWNGQKDYESKHGKMTPEQFRTMVNSIANQTKQKQIQGNYKIARQELQAKQGEKQVLVNFKQQDIPQIEKKLGNRQLYISSTYRKPNGKYHSYHSDGLAVDIAYNYKDGKTMSTQERLKLVGEILANPKTKAIAISTADKYGKEIYNAYKNAYGSKIQDMNKRNANGKTQDQLLGTNHTTHVHVTLKEGQEQRVKVSDSRGNIYTVPASQLGLAISQGYKRI